ncbi:MAG: hypothetical protein ACRC45_06390, partial [Cetobacterium sp.]
TETANIEDVASEISVDVVEPEEVKVVETETPTEENKEESSPENDEDSKFSPEDIDFNENKLTVEGYNLEKYAEVFDFDNENNIKMIGAEMQKLKEKGYTQKEAEIFIDAKIEAIEEYEADIKPVPVTKSEVMKVLTESLSREEKANYKPILGWTKEVGESIGLTPSQINEAMSNPILVKLMNGFYKKAVGNGGVKTAEVKAPESSITMDFGTAMKQVQDEIIKGTPKDDVIKFAKNLETSLKGEQLEQFKATFGRIFGVK